MMDPCEGKDTRADRLRRRSLEEQGRGKTRRGEILQPQKAAGQDNKLDGGPTRGSRRATEQADTGAWACWWGGAWAMSLGRSRERRSGTMVMKRTVTATKTAYQPAPGV